MPCRAGSCSAGVLGGPGDGVVDGAERVCQARSTTIAATTDNRRVRNLIWERSRRNRVFSLAAHCRKHQSRQRGVSDRAIRVALGLHAVRVVLVRGLLAFLLQPFRVSTFIDTGELGPAQIKHLNLINTRYRTLISPGGAGTCAAEFGAVPGRLGPTLSLTTLNRAVLIALHLVRTCACF